jgi:hypothetical protein
LKRDPGLAKVKEEPSANRQLFVAADDDVELVDDGGRDDDDAGDAYPYPGFDEADCESLVDAPSMAGTSGVDGHKGLFTRTMKLCHLLKLETILCLSLATQSDR